MSAEYGAINPISVNHIGVVVKDADKTSKLLTSVLGLGNWQSVDYISTQEQTLVGKPFRLKIMFAKLGPITLELLAPPEGEDSLWSQFIQTNGEGVHHISFSVPNWDEMVKKIEAEGGKMVVCSQFKGGEYDGKKWCYMDTKPGGVIIELMDNFGL